MKTYTSYQMEWTIKLIFPSREEIHILPLRAAGAAEAGVQGVQLHTHYFAPFFIKD